jgi:hypothetical protein
MIHLNNSSQKKGVAEKWKIERKTERSRQSLEMATDDRRAAFHAFQKSYSIKP